MKIISTIGPRSLGKETLKELIEAGTDILRLNCSHFNKYEFDSIIKNARNINSNIHIMVDLCGKKIRVSECLKNPYKIFKNDIVYFCGEDNYNGVKLRFNKFTKIIPLNIKEEILRVNTVEGISMKDNTMNFSIVDKSKGVIQAKVINSGIIRRGKGCNILGLNNYRKLMCKNDEYAISWSLDNSVDFLCQSYVECKEELESLSEYVDSLNFKCIKPDIWAKIETPRGVEKINEILENVEFVVIGRGDLVPEAGIVESVKLQNKAINIVKSHQKNIIMGTHILSSLKNGTKPTLPEIESIYAFINAGVSGFLLAGETSIGREPGLVVKLLRSIIDSCEN